MSNESSSPKWYENPQVWAGIAIVCLIIGYVFSFWIPLIGAIAGLIFSSNKAASKNKNKPPVDSINIQQFKSLGTSKEEREKNINKMFSQKDGILSFYTTYSFKASVQNPTNATIYVPKFTTLEFKISRHIAAIEQREREFLKTTLLLFNNEKINSRQYEYYLLAFIYGNGKASIDSWNYTNSYETFQDGPGVVKYYVDKMDASVDSAINSLISYMDEKEKGRLISGGTWLEEDDLADTIYNKGGNYELRLGNLNGNGTVLNYSGEGSLITIAPPGSGKTQCFVFPNLLSWKGAAVILDIKNEIYPATYKWRENNIGKVYVFNPLNPKNSNNYNPLSFIRNEPEYIWEESRFLADMMIVPSGIGESSFWENMARDVLTSAIAFICFNNEPDDRSMSKVLDIMYGIGWEEMILSMKTNVLVSSMRRMGNSLEQMDNKQLDSVLKTAQASLSAWQGERISQVTNKSDWNPLDLRNGTPTIYICLKANEIESYLSVIRVFIAQHLRMLTSELPPRGASPVLFMLDELPRLKKMPPVDEALNIGRQYGIKLWMFAQTYGQLKEAYPDPEGLLGSCVVRTFMNLPLNDEFTTKISDQLGYRHDVFGNMKEKVVEPIELAGPNYRDYILVLSTGTKPAKVKKKFAYEDEELVSKMN